MNGIIVAKRADSDMWKESSYFGYYANELGEVKGPRGHVLVGGIDWQGYAYHTIRIGKKQRNIKRATIVCDAWHGPRPEGMVVRHLDGDNTNNRPDNLRWGTLSENAKDRRGTSSDPRGEGNHNAKLTWSKVDEIRKLWATGEYTQQEIGNKFGIRQSKVSDIVLNKGWVR